MSIRRAAHFLLFPAALVTAFSAAFSLERSGAIVPSIIHPRVFSRELNRDMALSAELDEISRALRRRIELKERLIHELLAARLTLAEVAAQFLTLNQSRDADLPFTRNYDPGATDLKRAARNVIDYATPELALYPPLKRAMIMARLELQARELTASGSPVGPDSH